MSCTKCEARLKDKRDDRAERIRLGICAARWSCGEPVVAGRRACAKHLEMDKFRQARRKVK